MTPLKNKSYVRKRKIIMARRIIAVCVLLLVLTPVVICNWLSSEKNESGEVKEADAQAVNAALSGQTSADESVAQATTQEETTEEETQTQEETTVEDKKDKADEPKKQDDNDGVKRVYLTFDDGPSDNTDKILDILAENNVKATFFVIEKTDVADVEHYKRILSEGHTLAMHSSSHEYSIIYASMDAYITDVTQLQDYLESITGEKAKFYRFPGGSSNTVGQISMHDCVDWLNSQDITYFDWNVDSGDADRGGSSTDCIINNVVSGVSKLDNTVVLMHDTNAKGTTVEALPSIISQIKSMGGEMLPITDDTKPIHHRINR